MVNRGISEEDRAFLETYDRKKYESPSVAVDLLVFNQDMSKMLLITRAGHPYKNKLALPGGFYSKEDENLEEAASRELYEETSIKIKITEKDMVKVTSTKGRDPRGWVMSVAYMAVVDENDVRPVAADDALTANWVDLSAIKEADMAFDHYKIVQYALQSVK